MSNRFLVLSFLLFISFTSLSQIVINLDFEDVQIVDFNLYLTLPKGIERNTTEDFTEGIAQQFFYKDGSSVVLTTSPMGGLTLPENELEGYNFRLERIDRITFMYAVRNSRKAEFDKAFDFMKKNGLKKK